MEYIAMPLWKRAVDLMICSAAMPLLALIALRTAIMMRFTSPGPIFFRQECIGYGGKRFMRYRFRTMHVRSSRGIPEAQLANVVRSSATIMKMNIRNDSLYIPGGWLMRSLRLHELPQIINVLRGEMSLVGSRPFMPAEFEQRSSEQWPRLNAVPGLTGLWQVSGRSGINITGTILLDNLYVQRRSIWLDFKIMLLTVWVLLQRFLNGRSASQISSMRSGQSSRTAA